MSTISAVKVSEQGLDGVAQELAAQLEALRPGASADHLVRLGLDALHEVYVASDVTPQERARLRTALAELRAYAGWPTGRSARAVHPA